MKKLFLEVILLMAVSQTVAQNVMDSIQDMIDHWKKYGTTCVETGYMFSVHSNKDIGNYLHQKSFCLLDLGYKKSKVKVGVGYENLRFRNAELHNTSYSYDIQYILLPVSFLYQLFDFQWCQFYLGAGIEMDWILNYNFINEDNTGEHPSAKDPPIGQRTGLRLQMPVTWYFVLSQHWRCFVNAMVEFQCFEDHDKPEEPNKWGVITPERELDTGVPIWVGFGLTYKI